MSKSTISETLPLATAHGIGDDVPTTMRAWVLGDPEELTLAEKPVPVPQKAEVLVRIDAVAICATD